MGGAGGAVAAGGDGVRSDAITAVAVAGGCGCPVGVLTTPGPIGAAVVGATVAAPGTGVTPASAVAVGCGVLVNWRVAVGWPSELVPGTLVAPGVRVAAT